MSQLKQLLEKATQKNEMKWRVYAYDPAKDNKLVHTSELFDDINGAGIEKVEWLKKHPEHTIEIVAESAQKNEMFGPEDIVSFNKQTEFKKQYLQGKDKRKVNSNSFYFDNVYAVDDNTGSNIPGAKLGMKYKDLAAALDKFFESAQKNEGITYKHTIADRAKAVEEYKELSRQMTMAGISGTKPSPEMSKRSSELYKYLKDTEYLKNETADIDVKNPGVLEVPDGKKVDELPQSHFEKLVDKKGYAEVIRALTNLEVWNKDKNKSLSSWASNMADKLKKKYRPESSQKNEDTYKVVVRDVYGSNAIIKDAKDINQAKRLKFDLTNKYKHSPVYIIKNGEVLNESAQKNEDVIPVIHDSLIIRYKDKHSKSDFDAIVKMLKGLLKKASFITFSDIREELEGWRYSKDDIDKIIVAIGGKPESSQKNEYRDFKIGDRFKLKVPKKHNYRPGSYSGKVIAYFKNDDLDGAYFALMDDGIKQTVYQDNMIAESSQINETRGYTVTVELGVPDNMNNRDIEDEVERLLKTSHKIDVVMDVTAERK